MALHLNLLHEEIHEHRQRQRDPLKIGMMVLGALGAILFLYYMWNAYQTLEIRNRLNAIQRDWNKSLRQSKSKARPIMAIKNVPRPTIMW